MADIIFETFLRHQMEEGLALSRESDILDLYPIPPRVALLGVSPADLFRMATTELSPSGPGDPPVWLYVAVFHCRGLVRIGEKISQADRFEVAIQFHPDYLRVQPQAPEVLFWIGPAQVFHPNIRPPFLCPGRLQPGLSLSDLLYQIFEMISYQKVNPREDDALNRDACVWARHHQDRLPVDPRPLKRRRLKPPLMLETLLTYGGRVEQTDPLEEGERP